MRTNGNHIEGIMALDERIITQAIVERWHKKFQESLDVDVCIVGGGPAGIVAGYFLATRGHRVSLFERKLSLGGGMWGGGMMFNEIVVQEEARELLDQFGVPTVRFTGEYYCADSVLCTTTLASKACLAGLRIWNLMSIEDVVMRSERITGLVINWSPVKRLDLHVDPLSVRSAYVMDGTGHPAEITTLITRKMGVRLNNATGQVVGELPLWAHEGEQFTVVNTDEVYPGLFVTGMAANNAYGGPRHHVIGNHDMDGGFKREQTVAWYGMPARYHAFDHGGVRFITLDGNEGVLYNGAARVEEHVPHELIARLERLRRI